jgi:chemotaxis protein methyltransferase CheR
MQVTAEDITFVTRLVDELCGVVLDDTKAYLIESRLGELTRAAGCPSYRELCQKARYAGDRALQQKIIDAITTQETLFFRDTSPFEVLQHRLLPDIIDGKARTPFAKRIRIWSAAASTGQEPYSIAMCLCETIPDIAAWDVQILATDISDAAIKQASRGVYAAHEIQRGMQPRLLQKYFTPQDGSWRVKDQLRAMISYQRRNLLEPFVGIGPFDVIFCRNVAIYFDAVRRRDLFLRLADRLTPDGALLVGASESLLDLGPRFTPQNHCRATFYLPNKQQRPAPALAGR